MNVERKWAWPTRWPTTLKPNDIGSRGQIARLVKQYAGSGIGWVDPMCGQCKLCEIRNDFRTKGTSAIIHKDALEFLTSLPTASAIGVIYDPPYNDAQGKRYAKDHHSYSDLKYWWSIRKQIARVLKPGALAIVLAWNSNAIPGCDIEQVFLFAHGSERHDTIVTIQRKPLTLFS